NFVSDLIPGVPWIHAPITMGYDRYPELLIDEKIETLERVVANNEWLFLTHDPGTAICRVTRDERGRYKAADERAELHVSN
nr:MBL fold metallo-hydrolase [Pseudomonadota bacterium]